jgi:hypothetical protein
MERNANATEVDDMNLETAMTAMKAYKELDDRVSKFYKVLEESIIAPRIDLKDGGLVRIIIEGVRGCQSLVMFIFADLP